MQEGRPNIVDHIKNGEVDLVINTPLGEESRFDEYSIGWAAIEHKVAFITTLSAAATAVRAIEEIRHGKMSVKSLQEFHRAQIRFNKMSGTLLTYLAKYFHISRFFR